MGIDRPVSARRNGMFGFPTMNFLRKFPCFNLVKNLCGGGLREFPLSFA